MVDLAYELRPLAACRLTRVAGRPLLGFHALSDGTFQLHGPSFPLLPSGPGWAGRSLPGTDLHLLGLLDDLTSALAIQLRRPPIPELLGQGTAAEMLARYEAAVGAEGDEFDDVAQEVLLAGDFLVARSVYLPGDGRLLVVDRGETIEFACETHGAEAARGEFLFQLRAFADHFFLHMHARASELAAMGPLEKVMSPEQLALQGSQWQRRIEALLRRCIGQEFEQLTWPW